MREKAHGRFGSEGKMNRKQNVIEICIYVVIILLLIFGIGRLKQDEPQETAVPAVETPQEVERVQ